jgi:hypothetical protein
MVNGECHWQLGKPKWEAVYHHPILSKDGDVAWRILHNRIVTPQQLHKWGKRDTSDCPWCPGTTGTIDHMFFECPTAIAFWGHLTKTLHDLLGPHPLQKRHILYGYPTLDTTPQQLANYLLVLAKTTIYKTYLATNSTHQQPPDYQRMFRMRLQFRLHLEMHHSIWQHNNEIFTGYWLHRNILGKIQEGRIVLSDHI